MMRTLAILSLLLAAACREDVADRPAPVPLTAAAVGHYCQMDLLEHPGPKAQVHLDGMPYPLFFSQVRDALAYQRLPEQSHVIVAIYVSDMGAAPSWEDPGADNWIAAETAVYVAGSAVTGGMGVPELVPFADRDSAAAFIARHGGQALAMAEIPLTAILAPEGEPPAATADDGDFLRRLDALRQNSGG